MSAEEFFAVLEKTPTVDLEIELLSRSIKRTRENIESFQGAIKKLEGKLVKQKHEMIKLLVRAEAFSQKQMASAFEPSIKEEVAG